MKENVLFTVLDKCVSKDTRITYMTSGCALQIIRTNRNLENITHLIIDEVHERDIDIEINLLLAKDVLKRNKNIKVVIMSATVETDVYRNYFRVSASRTEFVINHKFSILIHCASMSGRVISMSRHFTSKIWLMRAQKVFANSILTFWMRVHNEFYEISRRTSVCQI